MKNIVLKKSGLVNLDQDIESVENVLNDEKKVAAIRSVLDKPGLEVEEFEKEIPPAILRVALASGPTEEGFSQLSAEAKAAAVSAAAAIESTLGGISSHHLYLTALSRMPEISKSAPLAQQLAEMGPGFEQVSRILTTSVYVGHFPKLRPGLKIAMYSSTNKLMFDSVLLWPAALFMIGTLMEHFAVEMKAAAELNGSKSIALDEERLTRSAGSLLSGFGKLAEQLEKYGIIVPSDDIASDGDSAKSA